MWSKWASELEDITRICQPKWNTPSSGCQDAPTDFGWQSVREFSSDENITIVVTVNVGIMLEIVVMMLASPLILSASRGTCICSDRLAASLGEYPLILIASGIFTLVSGFASQATKKRAAFLERRSTCYALLFEDMVKLASDGEKVGRMNNVPRGKGTNRKKATL